MKLLIENRLKRACLLGALAFLYGASNVLLRAGEPIIFSNEKSKSGPANDTKRGQETFNPWSKVTPHTPFDALSSPSLNPLRRANPKDDKRAQNARDERNNWMMLDPGELQDQEGEEGSFGVRDDNLDGLEKSDRNGNYIFHNLGNRLSDRQGKSSERRSPGQMRQPSKADQINQQRDREEQDAEARQEARNFLNSSAREARLGAHISSDLDLKNLWESSRPDTRPGEKSEMSLRDLLTPSAAPSRSREQQALMSNFKELLNAPSSGGLPSGSSDPINFRSGAERQTMNPVVAKPSESFSKSPGNSFFSPAQNPGGSPNRFRPPGLYDVSAPRVSGFSALPLPTARPAEAPRVTTSPPAKGFEMPRRNGL